MEDLSVSELNLKRNTGHFGKLKKIYYVQLYQCVNQIVEENNFLFGESVYGAMGF